MPRAAFTGIASKRCSCRLGVTTFTPTKGPAKVHITPGRGLIRGEGATL
jgi:hypothetical protein